MALTPNPQHLALPIPVDCPINIKLFSSLGQRWLGNTNKRLLSNVTSMVATHSPKLPPPWPSSKGVSNPSPGEFSLFLSVIRKEVTINGLLAHSASSSAQQHHRDPLWERIWADLSDITPRIQFHSTNTQARPALTSVLGGDTSTGHSKGGFPH